MNFLIIPLFLNLWIWKILSTSIILFLLVVLSSLTLYLSASTNIKFTKVFALLFVLLLFFQLKTTERTSLTNLSNDQIRIRDMRLTEYPPTYIRIGQRAKWFRISEWFEDRAEFRVVTRVLNNFSEIVDPNLYFFSNHPRERVGVEEFEKFPFIFLPLTGYGILKIVDRKRKSYLLSFFGPLILISLIGNNNGLGPFSIFPFMVVSTGVGLKQVYTKMNNKIFTHKRLISVSFVILTVVILIQMYSYSVY